METYSFLRELADSWVLLAMTLFFLSVFVWVIRPGSNAIHRDISNIPFRNEDTPACEKDCPDCNCKKVGAQLEEMSS